MPNGGKFYAVALIEALHLYPILYLNLAAALANCDPALQEAARNLGAGRMQRFFKVTLPLIRPGILAGGSLVLIWSFTELGTPLMFGFTRVTPVQVFDGLSELESNPMPYALVLVMMIAASLLYLAGRLLAGGGGGSSAVKGSSGSVAEKLHGFSAWLPGIVFAVVCDGKPVAVSGKNTLFSTDGKNWKKGLERGFPPVGPWGTPSRFIQK